MTCGSCANNTARGHQGSAVPQLLLMVMTLALLCNTQDKKPHPSVTGLRLVGITQDKVLVHVTTIPA